MRLIIVLSILAGIFFTGCSNGKKSGAGTCPEYLKLLEAQSPNGSDSKNFLTNSGFEKVDRKTGLPCGWSDGRRKQLSFSPNACEGESCAKLDLNGKPKWGPKYSRALFGQNVKLDSGAYAFSCKYKGRNISDMKVALVLSGSDKKRKDIRKHISILSDSKDWESRNFSFFIPEGWKGTRISIEFLGQRGKECVAYLDDLTLQKRAASANRMFNSSFEICTSPEIPDRWVSSAAKILDPKHFNTTLVTDAAHFGANSIKMTWDGPYSNNLAYYTRLMSGFCSDVEEGEKYTVSIWMKTDNPPAKMNLWVNYVNRKVFTVDSKEWKRYSFTSVWRQPYRKTRFAFILLFFAGKEGENMKANVWVDDVMAEKGTKASAWEPALQDGLYLKKSVDSPKLADGKAKAGEAGKYPRIEASKTTRALKIDGKLDEEAWAKAKPASCLKPFKRTQSINDTLCRVACDDEALYIGLTAKRKAGTKKAASKNGGVFSGDWIEFFLDPNSKDNVYYQFVVNEKGKVFTAQSFFDPISFEVPGASGFTINSSWRPEIACEVTENKDSWDAEMRIPLSLFKSEMKPGAPFRFNFYRVNTNTGEMNCWTKPSRNFHTIVDYGYLDGVNAPQNCADIKVSEVVFSPSPLGKSVDGRFSISGKSKAEKVEAELLTSKGVSEKLKMRRDGNSFAFDVPMSAKEARGKAVRIKAYVSKESKTPDAQAFSEVNIVSLLSFGLNSLVFRDEKTFPCKVTVRFPEAELKNCKLELTVISKKDGKKAISKSFAPKGRKAVYQIPFGTIPNGFYVIDMKLMSGGKPLATSSKWTYLGARKKQYSRVDIQNVSCLQLNGKPFFMLSAWQANPVPEVRLENLKKYKDAGFNCVWVQLANYRTPYEKMNHEKLFEMARKTGLYVIVDFCSLMTNGTKRHKYSRAKIMRIIKDFTKKYKDHPSLLMYHGMDEWWAGRSQKRAFCSDEDLEDVYWSIREIDPYHAFFFNLGPRPQAWGDLRFTDVFSYDCYVRANSPDEFDLDRFIYFLNYGKRYSVDDGKPMFNIIQFDAGTEVMQGRMLRYNEQRCLNYVTALNDSKGIGYFTGLCWCDHKNKEIARINREIETLAPVLLGFDASKWIETAHDSIQAKWYKYKGEYYIIAVNCSSKSVNDVSLDLAGSSLKNCEAEGMFGGDSEEIEAGTLSVSFAPYECKVFKAIR